MPFSDGLVTNIAETLGNPSCTTVTNTQMLGSSVITTQNDTKPPKATYNNPVTNQSLGNETPTRYEQETFRHDTHDMRDITAM